MLARSSAFAAAIGSSHTAVFKCEILSGGLVIANDIPIASGSSVQVDYTAAILRHGTINLIDKDGTLAPKTAADKLSPYGNEIRAYRGIKFQNGTTEFIPVGTLRIAKSVDQRGQIKIDCYDRARSVQRARFESPYTIAAGTNVAAAIQALISDRLSGITFRFTSTTSTTPLLVFDQASDPWASAQSMATSIGCDLYFDPLGVCVLEPTKNPATAPVVAQFIEGASSMLLQARSTMTDDPGYNGVVVDGQPPNGTPVHVVVYDTDPTSPTYAAGPYGKVPEFYASPMITTVAQATAAGTSALLRNRGGTEQVVATVLPDPCIEPSDMCFVYSKQEGINSNYIVESFSMPLDIVTTDITMRKRRSLG